MQCSIFQNRNKVQKQTKNFDHFTQLTPLTKVINRNHLRQKKGGGGRQRNTLMARDQKETTTDSGMNNGWTNFSAAIAPARGRQRFATFRTTVGQC